MVAHPTAYVARSRVRHGYTIIELAIVLGVIAIIAAVALPNLDFNRFRADGNARNVQNKLIMSQVRAVSKNMNIVIGFDWNRRQFAIVDDKNGNGAFNPGETINRFTLAEGFRFLQPPTTIDGAAPNYATGPGIRMVAGIPTLTLYPNGSTSGECVIYVGTSALRKTDFRAIQVLGATSKVYFWRMLSDGTWKKSDL